MKVSLFDFYLFSGQLAAMNSETGRLSIEILELSEGNRSVKMDLDNGKLKLSPISKRRVAPAHKSSRYLGGSIKTRIRMLLKVFATAGFGCEVRFIRS